MNLPGKRVFTLRRRRKLARRLDRFFAERHGPTWKHGIVTVTTGDLGDVGPTAHELRVAISFQRIGDRYVEVRFRRGRLIRCLTSWQMNDLLKSARVAMDHSAKRARQRRDQTLFVNAQTFLALRDIEAAIAAENDVMTSMASFVGNLRYAMDHVQRVLGGAVEAST